MHLHLRPVGRVIRTGVLALWIAGQIAYPLCDGLAKGRAKQNVSVKYDTRQESNHVKTRHAKDKTRFPKSNWVPNPDTTWKTWSPPERLVRTQAGIESAIRNTLNTHLSVPLDTALLCDLADLIMSPDSTPVQMSISKPSPSALLSPLSGNITPDSPSRPSALPGSMVYPQIDPKVELEQALSILDQNLIVCFGIHRPLRLVGENARSYLIEINRSQALPSADERFFSGMKWGWIFNEEKKP